MMEATAEEVHHTEHVPQWKIEEVEDIKNLIQSYSLFGIVSISGIPAKQLQVMRRELKDIAVLKVSRNTLVTRALEKAGGTAKDLEDYVDAQIGLIFTNENPFKIYKILEKSKSPSPIKPGAIAPKDIVVEEGATGFPPGPIIGDLQSVGIPAAIDSGKVSISETTTVAREGDKVSQKLAAMLNRLEIYPDEVGLDLKATTYEGSIFTSDQLAIDVDQYFSDFTTAVRQAFNLSVNAAYPTAENITTLISKGVSEARNLGVNATIIEPQLMDTHLSKAYSQMLSVAQIVYDKDENAVDDDLKQTLTSAATSKQETESGPTTEEETKESEEEEESEEESGMAGLGSLFG
nr:50S ribosomal protein L10 [Methanohalobium evestigatum]